MNFRILWAAMAATAAIGMAACEKQGPVERAGEEVDEAVDTIKNGEESTANKVDDALDEARDAAEDESKK
jgi:predicted aconitase